MASQQLLNVEEVLALDERKQSVLEHLQAMQTLTAYHIKFLVYSQLSMRTTYGVLDELVRKKLIAFHTYGGGRGIGNCERLYFLTKKGCQFLGNTLEKPSSLFRMKYFYHRKLTLDFWVVVRKEAQKYYNKIKLISFVPEWQKINGKMMILHCELPGGSQATIKPDATMIFHNLKHKINALFFIEIDTGTETLDSTSFPCIQQKINKYQKVLQQGTFQVISTDFASFKGARVLMVTNSNTRTIHMLHTLKIEEYLHDAFLFTTHHEVWQHGVLFGRYAKKGCGETVGINSMPIKTNQCE